MGLFNRKKKQKELVIPEIPHTCVMKDLPWYMEIRYNGTQHTAGYSIIEPYICINGCGKRINKVLEQCDWADISVEDREKEFEAIRKRYRKYLKPRAVVEDMINNILLVKDPDYLDMVEEMRGLPHRRCGTSAEMKRNENAENDIGYLEVPK